VDLVPDHLIGGIDIETPCRIHDLCYCYGQDEDDKRWADILLLVNMLLAVNQATGMWARIFRVAQRKMAYLYYEAVADWGQSAFWEGKDTWSR
jgi:hypothetical protein